MAPGKRGSQINGWEGKVNWNAPAWAVPGAAGCKGHNTRRLALAMLPRVRMQPEYCGQRRRETSITQGPRAPLSHVLRGLGLSLLVCHTRRRDRCAREALSIRAHCAKL